MFKFITSIVSGVVGPFFTFLNKKQDVDLEKFKVNGQVDMSLVNASVEIIRAQKDLLIAGVKDQGTRWLQYLFGYPLGIYYAKIILWDKVLGLGVTDPLTGDVSTYSMWIVGFLFLHSAVTGWSRKT